MTSATATGQIVAAVGIPQGLVVDPVDGNKHGAVRRGGDLVSVSPADYQTWEALATPRSSRGLHEVQALEQWPDLNDRLQRLRASRLVVDFDLARALTDDTEDLRPIPRGVGAGNVGDDTNIFRIHGPTATPLEVDPITVMLWWEFDGLTSLKRAVELVASRLPNVDSDQLGHLAVALTLALLAQRLIYLDCPAAVGRAA